jgi:hypothetical protein
VIFLALQGAFGPAPVPVAGPFYNEAMRRHFSARLFFLFSVFCPPDPFLSVRAHVSCVSPAELSSTADESRPRHCNSGRPHTVSGPTLVRASRRNSAVLSSVGNRHQKTQLPLLAADRSRAIQAAASSGETQPPSGSLRSESAVARARSFSDGTGKGTDRPGSRSVGLDSACGAVQPRLTTLVGQGACPRHR